jgi:ribosomal protein S27E
MEPNTILLEETESKAKRPHTSKCPECRSYDVKCYDHHSSRWECNTCGCHFSPMQRPG